MSAYTQHLSICSPINIEIKKSDAELMQEASVQLFSLLSSEQYRRFFLTHNNWFDASLLQVNHRPLSMIGVDFHITHEGPKIIEINSNAGGLVTSAIWAHRHDHQRMHNALSAFVLSMQESYREMTGNDLKTMAITDHDPEHQFTIYDFLLTKKLMESIGVRCDILDPKDLNSNYDFIYNRSCDFLLSSEDSQTMKSLYTSGDCCVAPNPYMFCLLSDKRAMVTINDFLSAHEGDYSALRSALLPCMHIRDFVATGNRRSGWYFKHAMQYGGADVFRGRKLSVAKLQHILSEDYIVQKEAKPATVLYNEVPFKYDVRVFVWKEQVIDLSIRTYRGRITNFRTPEGGYASFNVTP